ncbi:tetratricopeptide repeat protein [Thalassoglobus polymorphus]|uniref:tetratricopeptide repeat protein n=1 Tax=Thalassoglobus polymorphus TaxID=2527994 RepID=UPI0018D23BE2|nr:tetratricopeptide repeat protein [Thalassoglobus polymorphus]
MSTQQKLNYAALKVGESKGVQRSKNYEQGSYEQGNYEQSKTAESNEADSLGQPASGQPVLKRNGQRFARSTPVLLDEAEQAIQDARYEHAEDLLSEICKTQGARVDGRTFLKLAVCQETLGLYQEAVENYQTAISRTQSQPVLTAARLGRARIWSKSGKALSARNDLLRTLLTHQDVRSVAVEARLVHQIGLVSAAIALKSDAGLSSLSDDDLTIPAEEIAAEKFVNEILVTSRASNLPSSSDELVRNVLRLDSSSDSILLEVQSPGITVRDFLVQISAASGINCIIEEECLERLSQRNIATNFQGLPLSVIFDSVLFPLECCWVEQGNEIHVHSLENGDENVDLEQAERILRFAMTSAPEHSLAPISMTALAALKARQGDRTVALRGLQRTLEQFPDTSHAGEIWLNIGKCHLQKNGKEALAGFYKAADLGAGGDTDAIANLYIGRIHLRNACPTKAVSPLRIAQDLTVDDRLQMEILLSLAAAYQMSGQFSESEEVLTRCLQNRHSFEKRNEITIISSLIESGDLSPKMRTRRESVELISALSNLDFNSTFGEYWWFLSCREYHELGFNEEAQRLFQSQQSQHLGLPIEQQLRTLLFSGSSVESLASEEKCRRSIGAANDSLDMISSLPPNISLEELLELYKAVVSNPESSGKVKQYLLQKIGHVYQSQGQHDMAIQCYTGTLESVLSGNEP